MHVRNRPRRTWRSACHRPRVSFWFASQILLCPNRVRYVATIVSIVRSCSLRGSGRSNAFRNKGLSSCPLFHLRALPFRNRVFLNSLDSARSAAEVNPRRIFHGEPREIHKELVLLKVTRSAFVDIDDTIGKMVFPLCRVTKTASTFRPNTLLGHLFGIML